MITLFIIMLITFFSKIYLERKKVNRWKKFHSAEHMVLNAYRKLKRLPTIEEIKNFSMFSNTCGTNAITQILIISFAFFAESFILNRTYMIIIMSLSVIIVLVLIKIGFLNFIQYFTTDIPTEVELKVAIKGLKVWIKHEHNPKNNQN